MVVKDSRMKHPKPPNTTKDFIVIVGKKDEERFRQFRTEQHRDSLLSIQGTEHTLNIWAVNSHSHYGPWSMMQQGDRIFFAIIGSEFSHYGTVYGTLQNRDIATRLWGDTPRTRLHDCLILFSSTGDMSRPFHETCRNAGIRIPVRAGGVHLAKNRVPATPTHGNVTGVVVVEDGGGGPAARKSEVVTRFVRDTKKVRQLKQRYSDECQVCGYAIRVSYRIRYSEVHHIHPLKDGGDDSFANMLVLCPTHHVEFDYKAIGIAADGKTVVRSDGKPVGRLTLRRGHRIAMKNIDFHTEGMANGEL